MRLLSISYGFMLQRAYQWKAVELQRRCEEILVVIPEAWHELWSDAPVRREPGPLNRVPHREVRFLTNINKHLALLPLAELRDILSSFRPDVIEVDNEPFNLGSAQVVAASRRWAPGSRVFLHGAQNLLKRYPPPFNWTERYVFERCAGVFARNQNAADVLRRRGLAEEKIHVVGHGVSLEEYASARQMRESKPDEGRLGNPTASEPAPGPILYVGALTHQKGVDVLLRAMCLSRHAGRLILAGDGSDRASLEALANDLGLVDRAEFLGRVTHDHLLDLYAEAACLVLPSRTTPNLVEQFGRVLLEAMAAGCPVVASDSGNIPSVVGEAGLVFPEEDAVALADALDRVMGDPAERIRLHDAGLERVRRRFEWAVVADLMMEVFRREVSE